MLTRKSTQTYASTADRYGTPEYVQLRLEYISNAQVAGKTDGFIRSADPVGDDPGPVAELYWVDQAAAEEWKTWVIAAAAANGSVLLSVNIEELNPPVPLEV